jgi:hypothetical protein
MCDYSKGIIYKWVCDDCDEVYVGSTINFTRRKQSHKSACNNKDNKEYNTKKYQTMREYGGFENWRMIQIETYPCQSKRELEAREEEVKKEIKATLNDKRAFRTEEEHKEQKHKAYEKWIEKDGIRQHKKEWGKEYRDLNHEKIKEKKRIYNAKNKDKIAEKRTVKVTCECGGRYTLAGRSQHLKTRMHQCYAESNKHL